MKNLVLKPIKKINGSLTLPGSKSLSNRALLLAAIANGTTVLENILVGEDTTVMIRALRQLGIRIDEDGKDLNYKVYGIGKKFEVPSNREFSLGNAGTAIRPLAAMLALVPSDFTIDGDKYMRERPIAHLGDALESLGAKVSYMIKEGYPPIRIVGGNIKGGNVSVQGSISSQYLSSLLMALPMAKNSSSVTVTQELVSKPYIDITLSLMKTFGVEIHNESYQRFSIPGSQSYSSPERYLIEGDASSASYFFGAAAIKKGPVRVHGLGADSVQGDYKFLEVIEKMGAKVRRSDAWTEVVGSNLRGIDLDLNHIPDAAMTIAAMALFAEGPTKIRNIGNWRVKETDRMHAMTEGLLALGAKVLSTEDSIFIDPPIKLNDAKIKTYGDHRVAMSFSLAALGNATVTIDDPDCTRKTFPGYFKALASLSK